MRLSTTRSDEERTVYLSTKPQRGSSAANFRPFRGKGLAERLETHIDMQIPELLGSRWWELSDRVNSLVFLFLFARFILCCVYQLESKPRSFFGVVSERYATRRSYSNFRANIFEVFAFATRPGNCSLSLKPAQAPSHAYVSHVQCLPTCEESIDSVA